MRRRQGQFLMIFLAAVLVVAAAGCGGKKKSSTTTTTAAAATTSTAAATTAATTTTTAATTTAAGTTTSASSSNGLGSLASVENCKSLADLGTAFASALQGAGGDIQKETSIFQQFAAKTPSDIRPDFETIAAALAKAADALKGVNLTSGQAPDASALAKLNQLSTEFDSPAMKKAETDIQAWAAKNCHA